LPRAPRVIYAPGGVPAPVVVQRVPYHPDRPTVAELAAGGLVGRRGQDVLLLLHQTRDDRWCLPKGHVEPGESLGTAALREVREEAGLRALRLGPERIQVDYRFYDPKRRVNVVKIVVYFDMQGSGTALRLEAGFDAFVWCKAPEALRKVPFAADRQAIRAWVRARA
jgi:8-oxo-dGTP pyrophosphatase MutT (NUDIX family)